MQTFIQTNAVSLELALHIVTTAIAEAQRSGLAVAVAVADPAMGLVAYGRADGTTPHSAETSRRKAQTSASTRRPSGWMSEELAHMLPAGSGNLLTNIRGGVPITIAGRFLGAFGVAGGTPSQDETIARAVLAMIDADPIPPA